MLSVFRAKVSSSPLVQLVIATFLGAALPVIVPALDSQHLSLDVGKSAAYAGAAALVRAVILMLPAPGTPSA